MKVSFRLFCIKTTLPKPSLVCRSQYEGNSKERQSKMASAFSSKAEDVFTRNVEIGYENELKDELIEDYYEVETCVKFVTENSFEKVGMLRLKKTKTERA